MKSDDPGAPVRLHPLLPFRRFLIDAPLKIIAIGFEARLMFRLQAAERAVDIIRHLFAPAGVEPEVGIAGGMDIALGAQRGGIAGGDLQQGHPDRSI